jgi:hypothetical protein
VWRHQHLHLRLLQHINTTSKKNILEPAQTHKNRTARQHCCKKHYDLV